MMFQSKRLSRGPATQHHHQAAAGYSRLQQKRQRRALHCHASVVWRQLDRTKNWVTHPRSARTKGVIHFLGGAFAGAAPQLLYNSFIELLADDGYTVVSTPYKVTFQHDVCARQVRQAFLDSLAELRATGRSYLVPSKAPQYSVGHSNGALLQLLINSYEPGATDANVIISYNNLQVSDAIPIPGFLDSLQPTVQAARAAGVSSSSSMSNDEKGTSSDSGAEQQLLAVAAATLPLPQQQQLLIAGAAPVLEQLSSVVNEVGDGLTDFTPSPQESRAIITAGYACPATLLVQFENDNFDETPEMQQLLSERQASSSSSSSSAAATAATTASSSASNAAQPASDAAAVAGTARSLPQSGYTSAWSSIDEDVSMDNLLQQLQELQLSLQEQEQERQRPAAGVSDLEQLLLPGSHITPCGAQLQSPVGVSPIDVLIRDTSGPGSQADLQNLAQKVLAFLDSRRQLATQRRAAVQQRSMPVPGTDRSQTGPGAAGAAGDDNAGPVQVAATVTPSTVTTGPIA